LYHGDAQFYIPFHVAPTGWSWSHSYDEKI